MVTLHPNPKFKFMEYEEYLMEEYAITREDWDGMSQRERLYLEYNIEAGNEARFRMNDAIDFIEKIDESIIPKDEKKKIIKKMEKALETFTYPFTLNASQNTQDRGPLGHRQS